jgi:hypothetical protein
MADTLCSTCHEPSIDSLSCYQLPEVKPYVIPLFKPILNKFLECVCLTCSKPLLTREQLQDKAVSKLKGTQRINFIAELSKDLKCFTCNGTPKELKKNNLKEIHLSLQKFSKDDLTLFGFMNNAKPSDFISTRFPIKLPVVIKPNNGIN